MVVEGPGTPASGPRDILIENNRIARIVPSSARPPQAASTIDAAGKYVLPGLVNLHGHIQDERGGVPMDVNFCLKLWLASGITTVRDVGSAFEKSKTLRRQSIDGHIAAPRLFLYPFFNARTPAGAVQQVRDFKQMGADGIKHLGAYRDVMEAMRAEAAKLGLRTAHHAGVEETNAWDDVRLGTTTIEHWYGIPDAALAGEVQNFPPSFNYQNELDRFRYAGRLWREANPKKLSQVLEAMVKANVAWDPTLNIYEASRDLQRAQNHPWFADLLHPALDQFFKPNLSSHGSFFINWTTADEIYWRENYRIWMAALREFSQLGGLIGTGEDAGFIYQIQGFGLIRELELHQEAGFHPLTVLKHATYNGARILGKENEIGRIREGWLADLIIVNGNPLENFKLLYPTSGAIEWTIKDGILYHPPTLLQDVKQIVAKARKGPSREPKP
ncbi:MAG: amidohydrolase family protein [Acidobacteriia bacterium]|nr:amidohydrolase family protein [Terriglobia bacterium]